MRNESIGDMARDDTNSNNWTRPATLNTYLNGEYLEGLSYNDKVVSHNFSIGEVTPDNNDLVAQIASENGTMTFIWTSWPHMAANTPRNTKSDQKDDLNVYQYVCFI